MITRGLQFCSQAMLLGSVNEMRDILMAVVMALIFDTDDCICHILSFFPKNSNSPLTNRFFFLISLKTKLSDYTGRITSAKQSRKYS